MKRDPLKTKRRMRMEAAEAAAKKAQEEAVKATAPKKAAAKKPAPRKAAVKPADGVDHRANA